MAVFHKFSPLTKSLHHWHAFMSYSSVVCQRTGAAWFVKIPQPSYFNYSSVRHFHCCGSIAKKPKLKGSKKGKEANISVNNDIDEIFDTSSLIKEMEDQIHNLQEEYAKHLSTRSNILTYESMNVTLPEGNFPLNHIAKVSMKGPRLVVIQVTSSMMSAMKGITESIEINFGTAPQQQGNTLYLQIPMMSREQRERMVGTAKVLCTKCVNDLRKVESKFGKVINKVEAAGHVSVDIVRLARKYVEEMRRQFASKAETVQKEKQAELMKEVK